MQIPVREGAAYGTWTTFGNAAASLARGALARTTGRQAGVPGLIFSLSAKGTVGSNMSAGQRKASWLPAIVAMLVLVLVATDLFLVATDLFMTSIATTALVDAFDASAGMLQAAIALFSLALASFRILAGKLGGIYGEKRVFQIGLVICGISALSLSLLVSISEFTMRRSVAAASGR